MIRDSSKLELNLINDLVINQPLATALLHSSNNGLPDPNQGSLELLKKNEFTNALRPKNYRRVRIELSRAREDSRGNCSPLSDLLQIAAGKRSACEFCLLLGSDTEDDFDEPDLCGDIVVRSGFRLQAALRMWRLLPDNFLWFSTFLPVPFIWRQPVVAARKSR